MPNKTPINELHRRLSEVIEEAANRVGGNYKQLERELQGEHPAATIDRRKLKAIAAGAQDIPLYLEELQCLHDYMAARGVGLLAPFGSQTLASVLAASDSIAFVVGSVPRMKELRIDVSRWDIRALREVLVAVNGVGRSPHISIEDEIFRRNADQKFRNGVVDPRETWYASLSPHGPTTVILGSSKVSHATEVALADMFGVPRFAQWPTDRPRPFGFYWPEDDGIGSRVPSAFRLSPDELDSLPTLPGAPRLERTKLVNEGLAFFDGEHLHELDRTELEWHTFAVVAAQRRQRRAWAVIAGLTGPATFGAARMATWLSVNLPTPPADEISPPHYCVVRVRVRCQPPKGSDAEEEGRADERRVVGEEIHFGFREYKEFGTNLG